MGWRWLGRRWRGWRLGRWHLDGRRLGRWHLGRWHLGRRWLDRRRLRLFLLLGSGVAGPRGDLAKLRRRLGFRSRWRRWRLRSWNILAEVAPGRLHVGVFGTEGARAVPGDPGVVAPRLVPVAQLVGERRVVREREEQRMVLAERELPRREPFLQQPPGGGELAEPAVERG